MNITIMGVRLIILVIIIIIIIIISYSCTGDFGNINREVESGFDIRIRNYSDVSYTGCTLYIGAINENNNYVALDSIVYPNLYIRSKNEEGQTDSSGRIFSTTTPFKNNKQKLTKYSTWAPPSDAVVKEISPTGEISLKLKLFEGKTGVFNTDRFRHGTKIIFISEDGSF